MQKLMNMIPDVELMLSLSTEELASKLIRLLQIEQQDGNHSFHCGNLALEFDKRPTEGQQNYPVDRRIEAKQAFFESYAYLEAQALIVWSPNDGSSGWRRLSRKALSFKDESEFLAFATGKQLRPEMLHQDIAMPVWKAFSRGEFDVAIFLAMKAVEVSVKVSSGLALNLFGVKLMREAFNIEKGPLTDLVLEVPEREALLALFSGAIGWFKNPHSHRNVGVSEAREAIETILFANRLLNIVDDRVRAMNTAKL